MIVLHLHEPDELPEITVSSEPHVLRLSTVEAHRQGDYIPFGIRDAVAYLLAMSLRLWAFFLIEDAGKWAMKYEGDQADAVRHVVWSYMTTEAAPEPQFLVPVIYENETDI